MNRLGACIAAIVGVASGAAAGAAAQDRQDVLFQITYSQTQVGQSVFVLGDLPELGASDVRRAVKLEPAQWPLWKATISLPTNTSYTYRFVRRDDAPGRLGDATNQLAIGGTLSAATAGATVSPSSKAIVYHSGLTPPTLWWRITTGGPFTPTTMLAIGPGRSPGETRWIAWDLPGPRRTIEFYFTSADQSVRDPATGTYSTPLDGAFVQDGNVFSYPPASNVGAWRRDYSPASPPTIVSSNLSSETRRYRVILPRGYDQHVATRYPVVYFHDGQNVFETGPFGTWDADDTAANLIRAGRLREVIMVGVDNGPNRLQDYAAPDSGGWADRYARFLRDELKPRIDGQYRTLTGPGDTGAIGSSMGGQVSLYLGWDFTPTFQRIGAFSGAWNVFSTGFYDRVFSQPKRNIRLYLDSGDSGTASDNYWLTFNLRDNLLSRSGPRYVLESDLKHVVGLGQQHNEAAWASRLPEAMRFLFPPTEGPQPLVPLASGSIFDADASGTADAEDLYRLAAGPADVNLDGRTDASDTLAARAYLRRGERTDAASGRR